MAPQNLNTTGRSNLALGTMRPTSPLSALVQLYLINNHPKLPQPHSQLLISYIHSHPFSPYTVPPALGTRVTL